MVVAVIVLGAAAEAGAWAFLTRARKSVWVVMSSTLAAMGVAALVARAPALSARVAPLTALAAGLGTGASLYVATRVFVALVSRPWPAFRRHSLETYARQGSLPLAVAVLLAVAVNAAAEELFWRGLVQARLSHDVGMTGGGVLAWFAFVGVNLPSANLAIVAGAVVGGAAWTALAWWTHGVLASFACHGLWTSLMLAFPVVRSTGDGR